MGGMFQWPWVIDRAMNRKLFGAYVEIQLAPTLNKGDVVILDNLSSHESPDAEKLLKSVGAWFLFLPPYSPDLNPIEMAFTVAVISTVRDYSRLGHVPRKKAA